MSMNMTVHYRMTQRTGLAVRPHRVSWQARWAPLRKKSFAKVAKKSYCHAGIRRGHGSDRPAQNMDGTEGPLVEKAAGWRTRCAP